MDSDQVWHVCIFGAMTLWSTFVRPWWVTVAIVIAAGLFYPIGSHKK